MPRFWIFAILMALVLAAFSLGSPIGQLPPHTKKFQFQGIVLRVTITAQDVPTDPWLGYWGAGEGPGKNFVSAMDWAGKDGVRYSLPRSAFADLADVNRVVGRAKGNLFIIDIEGADAGDSYDARLTFKDGRLIERSVASGEFPREHREDTVNTNLPTGD
jgi:hypothetical protein